MSFDQNGPVEIVIEGAISGCDDVDEFLDKFIEFVEDNEWSFGGGIVKLIDGWVVDTNDQPTKEYQ